MLDRERCSKQTELASSLSKSSNKADAALHCLVTLNPEMADKTAVAKCVAKAGDTGDLDSGAKRNEVKRSGFAHPFQVRQARLGKAS